MNRRTFLQNSTGLAAGLTLSNLFELQAKSISSIGIQLYTLRDLLEQQLESNLEKLASLGYKDLECFPSQKGHFWGLDAVVFANLAKSFGLKLISTHIPFGEPKPSKPIATLLEGLDPFIDRFAEAGGRYLVCPNLDKSLRSSLSELDRVCEVFNRVGARCRSKGIQFCYHNHDFEFQNLEGVQIYRYLLDHTDSKLVKFEIDLYWAARADQDIPALFSQYPGRFPLVHMKDMGKADKATVEVGSGTIDFKGIFSFAKKAGFKHIFVEQDHCPGNPLDSVAKSMQYLKSFKY